MATGTMFRRMVILLVLFTNSRLPSAASNILGTDHIDSSDPGAIVGGVLISATLSGDTILLFNGSDTRVYGLNGNDFIYGGEGSDTLIKGGDGDDILGGGRGDDGALFAGLFGGDGNDKIFGGPGADSDLYGNDGDDYIYAGPGDDYWIFGSTGNDIINGGPGQDGNMYGGPNEDIVNAGTGNDFYIAGGTGNDVIDAGDGDDIVIRGNAGNDAINAGAGNDFAINGGLGFDTITGGAGNDTIFASEHDTFVFGSTDGHDVLTGLDDPDSVIFSIPENAFVSVEFVGNGTLLHIDHTTIFIAGFAYNVTDLNFAPAEDGGSDNLVSIVVGVTVAVLLFAAMLFTFNYYGKIKQPNAEASKSSEIP